MKVTEEMIETFWRGKAAGGMGTGTAGPGPGLEAVLADVPEAKYIAAVEKLALAAVHATRTDDVDEWNALVDIVTAIPAIVLGELEEREAK